MPTSKIVAIQTRSPPRNDFQARPFNHEHLAIMNSWFFTLAFWSPGPGEMMVLAVVALLLYGGNLPEVARSWGKTFAEFRRGLTGLQSEINDVIYSEPEQIEYRDDAYVPEGYVEEESVDDEVESFDAKKTNSGTSADTVAIEKPTD